MSWWANETIFTLIELYKKEPILWQTSMINNKNKTLILRETNEAWDRISIAMKMSVPTVKNKISVLMATYRSFLKKKQSSDKYSIQWVFYEVMDASFRDECNLRIKKHMKKLDSQAYCWTDDKTFEFIALLKGEPDIWNTRNGRKDAELVNRAWQRISDTMVIPVAKLEAKRDSLMGDFAYHTKMRESCSNSGISLSDWQFFDVMADFLKEELDKLNAFWTDEKSFELIKLLKEHPQLWLTMMQNKETIEINLAWDIISDKIGTTKMQVKKQKAQLFRTYSALRTKHSRNKNGCYKGWVFYNALDEYLKDVSLCDNKEKNYDKEESVCVETVNDNRSNVNSAVINISSNDDSDAKSEPSTKKPRHTPQITNNTKILPHSKNEDESAIFGKRLARKLRQVTDVARQKIMYDIQGMFLSRSQEKPRGLLPVVAEKSAVENLEEVEGMLSEEGIKPDPFDDIMFMPSYCTGNSRVMVIPGEGYGLAVRIPKSDSSPHQKNPEPTDSPATRTGTTRVTKAMRAVIINMHKRNLSISAIARRLKLSRRIVQLTVYRYLKSGPRDQHRPGPINQLQPGPIDQLRPGPIDQLRPGPINQLRPGSIDQHQSGPQAVAHTDPSPKNSGEMPHLTTPHTANRITLGTPGNSQALFTRKVFISTANRQNRLDFARKYLNFDWCNNVVIFTDEMWFKTHTDRCQLLWRKPGARYSRTKTLSCWPCELITLGYWGWISSKGVGDLVETDGGQTVENYVDILQNVMLPSVRSAYPDEHIYFVQDNCSIHQSYLVKNWLRNQKNFTVINWPAKNSDMNPVDIIWDSLLSNWDPLKVSSETDLDDVVRVTWESFRGSDLCLKTMRSMRQRLQDVLDNNGAMIGY